MSRTTAAGASVAALAAAVALALIAPATAHATAGKQVRYIGVHPVPKAEGGFICYIEGPHVHIFEADKLQYRDHHGAAYFVGDPVAYGYDGPRFAYKGHHPIQVHVVVAEPEPEPDEVYCYLSGPHYHAFAPAEGPDFQMAGNAYFYVGAPPPVYVDARPAMMKINAVYQPLVYERPVITVDAPEGWIGARAEFAAPVVVVEPPRPAAAVVVAPPRVGVGISVQAIVPPPPSISIGVGIGVGVGGGVIVRDRPPRRVIHHDNRHRHR